MDTAKISTTGRRSQIETLVSKISKVVQKNFKKDNKYVKNCPESVIRENCTKVSFSDITPLPKTCKLNPEICKSDKDLFKNNENVNIENVNVFLSNCDCKRLNSLPSPLASEKCEIKNSNPENESAQVSAFNISPKNILVKLKCKDNKLFAFLDSGSEISLIKQSVSDVLCRKYKFKVIKPDLNAESINNNPISLTGIINIPFKFGRHTIYHKFYVAKDVGFSGALLLRIDFLNKANANIQ